MDNLQITKRASGKPTSRSASPGRARNTSEGSDSVKFSESVDGSKRERQERQVSPTNPGLLHRRGMETEEYSTQAELCFETPSELIAATELDDGTEFFISPASFLNGGGDFVVSGTYSDEMDSANVSNPPTSTSIHHLQNKIARTKDLIRREQNERDGNVNEYLKLAANADKQQLVRIKAMFEKKNQKSAHLISQLQKKLEVYNKRMKDLESPSNTSSAKQPRTVLRDVGQGLKNVGGNIRDGITGFSGTVMSKPREFAHLIKNKFGSADNINQISRGSSGDVSTGGGSANTPHHGSVTLPAGTVSTITTSQAGSHTHSAMKFPSDEGSDCSSVTSESIPGYQSGSGNHADSGTNRLHDAFSLRPIFLELQERREENERLRERVDQLKTLQSDVQFLNSSLQEERFRSERLEEQINDLTELHQNEVENLKQALADMEEKVQYQSEERMRDIHEILEHCQTKIQKMEHQALQQQQYVSLEGLDNSNARALVVKLINVLLTVLQVIFLLIATTAGITMPFLRSRIRILTTITILVVAVFVLKQWPEVQDVGYHILRYIKRTYDV